MKFNFWLHGSVISLSFKLRSFWVCNEELRLTWYCFRCCGCCFYYCYCMLRLLHEISYVCDVCVFLPVYISKLVYEQIFSWCGENLWRNIFLWFFIAHGMGFGIAFFRINSDGVQFSIVVRMFSFTLCVYMHNLSYFVDDNMLMRLRAPPYQNFSIQGIILINSPI